MVPHFLYYIRRRLAYFCILTLAMVFAPTDLIFAQSARDINSSEVERTSPPSTESLLTAGLRWPASSKAETVEVCQKYISRAYNVSKAVEMVCESVATAWHPKISEKKAKHSWRAPPDQGNGNDDSIKNDLARQAAALGYLYVDVSVEPEKKGAIRGQAISNLFSIPNLLPPSFPGGIHFHGAHVTTPLVLENITTSVGLGFSETLIESGIVYRNFQGRAPQGASAANLHGPNRVSVVVERSNLAGGIIFGKDTIIRGKVVSYLSNISELESRASIVHGELDIWKSNLKLLGLYDSELHGGAYVVDNNISAIQMKEDLHTGRTQISGNIIDGRFWIGYNSFYPNTERFFSPNSRVTPLIISDNRIRGPMTFIRNQTSCSADKLDLSQNTYERQLQIQTPFSMCRQSLCASGQTARSCSQKDKNQFGSFYAYNAKANLSAKKDNQSLKTAARGNPPEKNNPMVVNASTKIIHSDNLSRVKQFRWGGEISLAKSSGMSTLLIQSPDKLYPSTNEFRRCRPLERQNAHPWFKFKDDKSIGYVNQKPGIGPEEVVVLNFDNARFSVVNWSVPEGCGFRWLGAGFEYDNIDVGRGIYLGTQNGNPTSKIEGMEREDVLSPWLKTLAGTAESQLSAMKYYGEWLVQEGFAVRGKNVLENATRLEIVQGSEGWLKSDILRAYWFVGYGYKPERALIVIIALWLVCAICYSAYMYICKYYFREQGSPSGFQPFDTSVEKGATGPLQYSLDATLPFLNLHAYEKFYPTHEVMRIVAKVQYLMAYGLWALLAASWSISTS